MLIAAGAKVAQRAFYGDGGALTAAAAVIVLG